MPSPFPGMDPYLEGSLWTNVHTQLSVEIAGQLAPRLRPRYMPFTEKRFTIAAPGDEDGIAVGTVDLRPDVAAAESGRGPVRVKPTGSQPTGSPSSSAATGLAPPLRLATVMPVSVPFVTVEIRDLENRQLVTAIEVLSPANKRGTTRREYLAKRHRLLMSTAHLMEIDLLREGHRVPMRQPLPPAPYFVLLSRAESRPVTDVWPIELSQPLPVVPVPLLPGDADVELDLRAALAAVYDRFSYDLAVDYTQPPEPPLKPAEETWARDRLGIPRRAGST